MFEDGHLILCLTDDEHIGYQDQTKPYVLWARADGDSVIVRFSEELDPQTSQSVSSYSIAGVSVNSTTLMPDQRTVKLDVSGLILENTYNLTILGIKDDNEFRILR